MTYPSQAPAAGTLIELFALDRPVDTSVLGCGVSNPQQKTGMLWGGVFGVAVALLVWLLGANTKALAGLSVAAMGLLQLFPLAAWGPKTKEQQANRKRGAVAGVALVLAGEGALVADYRVGAALMALAGAGMVTLFARVPRSFWEAEEARDAEPKND